MAAWPTLPEVRKFLRLQPDANEDAVISGALAAAVEYGRGRLALPDPYPDPEVVPDAAHQACLMHAARLYKRRDSIDGTIGYGDMGAIRVGRYDADIDALYSLLGPLVFG